MSSYHRAGAFSVQIKIAGIKNLLCLLELLFIASVDGTGKTELGVVGNLKRMVKISCFYHGKDRTENFFL